MATRPKPPLVIDMPVSVETGSVSLPERAAWVDSAMFYGLLGLLMLGPLAFGGTEAWTLFVTRTAALILFALWAVRQYVLGAVELSNNPVYLPSVLFAGIVILQFLTGLTSYRYDTLEQGLDLIPLGVVMLLAGEMFSRRQRLHQAVTVLSVFGFAVAVFAIIQDFSGNGSIYWIVKVRAISADIYGPYANHNHYAGLMEMLVPLAAAAAFLEQGGKRALFLFASTIMALSIVFSRSRGGMLGLACSIVFVCAVLYRRHRQQRAALTMMAMSVLVTIGAIFLANDKIIQRLTDAQDKYRLAIYSDSLHLWMQRPFLGFGWGTFPTVYPAFRSFYLNMRVNHAHNDYLELLVETGIVGVLIASWFLFGVIRQGFRKILDKTDYEGGLLALGGMTAIVALLAHSALDFNLHIPANAALFFAICSAVATPYRRRVRQLPFIHAEEEEEVQPVTVEGRA
jgi:O-antigen ligase